jgi:HD-GYP domain-containing protein (c-di-GMP phosphodiesterase class II)
METIHDLLGELFNHSLETYRHSLRVGDTCYAFANFLGLKQPEKLFLLGAIHDIGKVKISSDLLNKKGRLTEQEFAEIKRHTLYGEQIVATLTELPEEFAKVVLYHHEDWNGEGYYGIEGDEIPLLSRILRIIDSYDTMLHGRIYKQWMRQDQVIQELYSLGGKRYDMKLIKAFARFINTKYTLNAQVVLENLA